MRMDPSQNDLNSLVRRAQAGEETSIGELFERFHRAIHRFLAYRVSSKEDAEDLTQNVFLEMVRSLPNYQLRRNASFSSWLFRIARHRLIDHYRKRPPPVSLDAVDPQHAGLAHEPDPPFIDERTKLIRQAMRRLPETYQTILQLTFIDDMSLNEAAVIMEISALSARVLKFRAIRKIRVLINLD